MLSTYKEGVERASTRLLFLRHNHVWPQTNAAELHIIAHLRSALRTCAACLSYAGITKTINPALIYRNIKSQDDFAM